GNNLELSVLGSDDKVTISNWYASASNHVETIKTADGKTLLDSQVQNLVNAMAAFAPPTAGSSNLTPEQRAQLEVVIAANWH
ncbi:calcium-binding protein, partial [Pseudomonas otitidis]